MDLNDSKVYNMHKSSSSLRMKGSHLYTTDKSTLKNPKTENYFSSGVGICNNSVEGNHAFKNHKVTSSDTSNLGSTERATHIPQLNSDMHQRYSYMNAHNVNTNN